MKSFGENHLFNLLEHALRKVDRMESELQSLREKLERVERAGEGYPDPPTRDRYAKVRPSWDPESLAQVSRDLADNT